MTTTINASATNGLVTTADGSGVVKLQSNGVTTNALSWLNYGYVSSTVTTRTSYNVSSLTRSSTGLNTVGFTTSLSDANYLVLGACEGSGIPSTIGQYASGGVGSAPTGKTTSSDQILCGSGSSSYDPHTGSVMFFGN